MLQLQVTVHKSLNGTFVICSCLKKEEKRMIMCMHNLKKTKGRTFLINDELNTFYLSLYSIGHMV